MTAPSRLQIGLHNLTAALRVPAAGQYWLTRPAGAARWSLIAPVNGELVWIDNIAQGVLKEAEETGLVRLGDWTRIPAYRGGGHQNQWRARQTGRPIALAVVVPVKPTPLHTAPQARDNHAA